MRIDFNGETEESKKQELEERELSKKQEATRIALGKFNFFLHVTGYLAGCSYLVILGILFPRWLPVVLVPVALWTGGIMYHGYRAFHPKKKKEEL